MNLNGRVSNERRTFTPCSEQFCLWLFVWCCVWLALFCCAWAALLISVGLVGPVGGVCPSVTLSRRHPRAGLQRRLAGNRAVGRIAGPRRRLYTVGDEFCSGRPFVVGWVGRPSWCSYAYKVNRLGACPSVPRRQPGRSASVPRRRPCRWACSDWFGYVLVACCVAWLVSLIIAQKLSSNRVWDSPENVKDVSRGKSEAPCASFRNEMTLIVIERFFS